MPAVVAQKMHPVSRARPEEETLHTYEHSKGRGVQEGQEIVALFYSGHHDVE